MHEVSKILLDDYQIPVDSAASLGTTALIRSASENDITLAKMLIERGADPYKCNWYGSTLHCVAEAGHREMMEYLLGLGLDVDLRDDKEEHHYIVRLKWVAPLLPCCCYREAPPLTLPIMKASLLFGRQ
jgi:ankyrin repeat protein